MSRFDFWRGKRVFLTGHTGFKGSWLCKVFEALGADVTGYALSPQDELNLYGLCKPKVNSLIADIRDFDKLLESMKENQPEIVIHMAAQPLVLDSYRAPRYTYAVNTMGTVNLLECVRLTDTVKSVLNITTDKVYLNFEKAAGYKEDEQLNGHDPYSSSKSCSEFVTSSYNNAFFAQKGVSVSTARSGNVIGGGDFAANRLIPDCAKAVSAGEAIKVRNPDSVRPYLHVLDSLFAYLDIIEAQHSDTLLTGAYNIGPAASACASNREVVDLFCKAWGEKARWEHIPTDNLHESGLLRLDCSKIERTLGWIPRWCVDKAIKETIKWYKAYFNGNDCNAVMAEQIGAFLQ